MWSYRGYLEAILSVIQWRRKRIFISRKVQISYSIAIQISFVITVQATTKVIYTRYSKHEPAQTHKSISFIWIVWSTLYLYLWSPAGKVHHSLHCMPMFTVAVLPRKSYLENPWNQFWLHQIDSKMLVSVICN